MIFCGTYSLARAVAHVHATSVRSAADSECRPREAGMRRLEIFQKQGRERREVNGRVSTSFGGFQFSNVKLGGKLMCRTVFRGLVVVGEIDPLATNLKRGLAFVYGTMPCMVQCDILLNKRLFALGVLSLCSTHSLNRYRYVRPPLAP